MRKFLFIALGLLLVNGLMVAEARAQPNVPFTTKITNNERAINVAFGRVFGRDATPDENGQWKKSDVTLGELIKGLHEVLKSEAGTDELRKTIGRSYRTSFGREPTAKELAFWTAEAKAKGYGFTELAAAYLAWLKTPEADSERKSLVFRNFFEVYGRLPTVSESNIWRDIIEQGKENYNYSTLLEWNLDRMLLPSTVVLLGEVHEPLWNELHDMIKRAFLTAGKGEPVEPQYNEWTAKVKDQKLTFKKLVAMLKNQTRAGVKLNGEAAFAQQGGVVPSAESENSFQKPPQTRANTRVKVINLAKSNEQRTIAKSRDLTLGKPFKLGVLSTIELLKAMETSPHPPPELKNIAPNNLSDYVKLTPQQPYVAGKGSLNFSKSSVDTEQNVASLENSDNSSFLFATFTPSAAGRNYLVELGIRAGDVDPEHQHPIVVGIGGFFAPDEVSQQYLKYDDHQLVFFRTAKNSDPITVSVSSTAGVLFKYLRVVELK